MMKRKIRIYTSFEEQELDALNDMRQTSAMERFAILYEMQEFVKRFHPPKDDTRKIIIVHEPTDQ